MTTIELSYNNLVGSIPQSFSELSSLQLLSLENNSLSGSVPTAIWQNKSFENNKLLVDLRNNNFSERTMTKMISEAEKFVYVYISQLMVCAYFAWLHISLPNPLCSPELYVLPEETPSPPPEPIAALLSLILWQLNSPDLFDMYSAGIVLLQMAVPTLRSSAALKNFNFEIKSVDYDLNRWRERTRTKPDLSILDLDSGKGWDLVTKLISERGSLRRGRLSASASLRHPYFLLGGDQAAALLSKLSFSK